jgi:ubiquinone/menaquinone biosynthesis C-methylase UbiE
MGKFDFRPKPIIWVWPPDIMSEQIMPYKPTWWGNLQQHLGRYLFAAPFTAGKSLLDVACGSGYGSAYLRFSGARQVVGADLSVEALRVAQRTSRNEGLSFVRVNATGLPFSELSFDVVVSFETIEHLPDPEKFLSEVHRVLKPGGLFLCSSPNADLAPIPGIPSGPYHIREFTISELCSLLDRLFSVEKVYGQLYIPKRHKRNLKGVVRSLLFRLGGPWLVWRTGIVLAFFLQFLQPEYRAIKLGDIPLAAFGRVTSKGFRPVPLEYKPDASPAMAIILARKL